VTIVVWWITCLIWSTVWLAIKVGVTSVPPLGFAGLRLAIAGAIVLPIAWRRAHRGLGAADLRLIAETGLLLLGANYAFTYWGSQFITSGMTATLQATTPAVWLRHRPCLAAG
jgi:drug/metabolite transporter (DMT)-like permease